MDKFIYFTKHTYTQYNIFLYRKIQLKPTDNNKKKKKIIQKNTATLYLIETNSIYEFRPLKLRNFYVVN